MQVPLELSFRGIERDDETEDLIREKLGKLEQVCRHMTSCRVAVEKRHKEQASGNPYRVRIDVRVPPGHAVVVDRRPGSNPQHDPLHTVIIDAFEAVRRQLKQLVDKQRRAVKEHPAQETVGIVGELVPEHGYGFLKTPDGREIYFHRNAVMNDAFDDLTPGTGVRFVEEQGQKGPQASTVAVIDRVGGALRARNAEA